MALEGTLRDFSFADILQLISLQRKTGVLTLKTEENLVTVSFLEGCIVGSSSLNQHPEDMIGLILVKRGEVSEAELEDYHRRAREDGRTLSAWVRWMLLRKQKKRRRPVPWSKKVSQ